MITKKQLKSGMVVTAETADMIKRIRWRPCGSYYYIDWKDKNLENHNGCAFHRKFSAAKALFTELELKGVIRWSPRKN